MCVCDDSCSIERSWLSVGILGEQREMKRKEKGVGEKERKGEVVG